MFCSRCGKTLMPEDTQCPHCGTPIGESRFEGTPYTSAQAHILPNTPAGQASAAYTRTSYTTMTEAQQQEGAVDSRTTYRPVYEESSAPEEIRRDMRAAIEGEEHAGEAEDQPALEDLSEDAQNTLSAVDEELKMESVDTSELRTRPIESTGRAGISTEVENYIQKLEATQSRRAARKRRAIDDGEEAYVTPQDDVAYDDTRVEADDEQGEVFEDIDEEEFDEIRYGRAIGVKEILRVAAIMVLAAALIVGGVLGFRYFRQRAQNTSKIEGVTQSLYESGVELIKAHREDTYINELVNVYRSDGVLSFTERVTKDSGAFDALLSEEPAVNDSLFVSALQTIHSNIGNAILMDATEADNVAGDSGQDSAARWAIVDEAIAQVENATTAQELTAVMNGDRVTVASSPTPTPEPVVVTYNTLSKGDKSDEVLDMQNRLFMLGFLLDDRDGDFGSKTQTAVKLFQQAAGLEATGIADSETLTRLYADDAPKTEYAQATATPAVTTQPTPEPAQEAEAEAEG